MPSAKPRKMKIRYIIRLILAYTEALINSGSSITTSKSAEDNLHAAKQVIDSAPIDLSNWSLNQNAVYDAAEAICTVAENEDWGNLADANTGLVSVL